MVAPSIDSDHCLKLLSEYSTEETNALAEVSSAASRYLQILNQLQPKNFSEEIRGMRHKAWLECALAAFYQNDSPFKICHYWSDVADEILNRTWREVRAHESLALFALGKLGSQELNLSSDIDLVVVSLDTTTQEMERQVQKLKRLMEEQTQQGFVFRVDYDLRPLGSWGPLVPTVAQFQDHYWSQGETWEKLALVRLRPLCGNPEVFHQVQTIAKKYSYRKFLDYTLHEDLKELRQKIHRKGSGREEQWRDLKLGIGGIRDAELFVHSLQVIHGGRIPDLTVAGTEAAILQIQSRMPELQNQLKILKENYWKLRNFENTVQIINDQQTHRFEKNFRYPNQESLSWDILLKTMKSTDEIVSELLGEINSHTQSLPMTEEEQNEWLKSLGYSSHIVDNLWPKLLKASALSLKKSRDENFRKEVLYRFLKELSHSKTGKDLAAEIFYEFIKNSRAKATMYAQILRNQKLLELLVQLFSELPRLAQRIAHRPELIDSFFYGQVELAGDTEAQLDGLLERKQLTEIHAAIEFKSRHNLSAPIAMLSSMADETAKDLLGIVRKETKSNFSILALGKWGSKELGFFSDLDFIFVSPGSITQNDFRGAKKFINYLTSPQKGGKIFEIDLRLRPHGGSSPLIVTMDQLQNYLTHQAQPWERQSYLKARPLEESFAWNNDSLFGKEITEDDLKELLRIREELLKSHGDKLSIKYANGGLIDIEFAAQVAILKYQIKDFDIGSTAALISALSQHNKNWETHGNEILKIYEKLRKYQQLMSLKMQHSGAELAPTNPVLNAVAEALSVNAESLLLDINSNLRDSSELLKHLDPIYVRG